MHAALAILAAGSATRAGEDKVVADLGGQPVLAWSLAAAAVSGAFDEIVVVAPVDRIASITTVAGSWAPRARVIAGGATRTASSWAALDALPDALVIAIHDAARPFVPAALLTRCVEVALEHGSAVAGLPLADTVRRARDGDAVEEVDREGLWAAQTPQVFARDLLVRARAAAGERTFSDDAAALMAAGISVRMVQGARRNLKITTGEDLEYAREVVASGLAGFPAATIR